MSTSLLYHAFGIRGYRHRGTAYAGGVVEFTIEEDRDRLRCSACGCSEVALRGSAERRFHAPPIGSRPVWIRFLVPRVECKACGLVRQVRIGFADPRRQYTKAFERYVLDLSRSMTITDVAQHLGVSWDLVKEIQARNLSRRFGKPDLRKVERIAIDEISVRKGWKYLTNVLDLDTGAVIFVGDGRGAAALEPFWGMLGRRRRRRIRAAAIDMAAGYAAAVRTNLPRTAVVFDRFHVVKLVNEKLSELRRELQREALGKAKQVLKGVRWLLVRNPDDLDEERNEAARLKAALALNAPLAAAYYLKEELRLLWDQGTWLKAAKWFDGWIERAKASGIPVMAKLARTLGSHREGILAWYDHPITTGPLEGVNNKIKVMKRSAYGFRDMEFFKLKILGLHETRRVLVG